jgi:hypothetical protein
MRQSARKRAGRALRHEGIGAGLSEGNPLKKTPDRRSQIPKRFKSDGIESFF